MSTDASSSFQARWLPHGSGPARWIVCERTGLWATALRREVEGSPTQIHETRSLAECWELLGRASASFVVAELTAANLQALMDRLASLERRHPLVRVAVVAERSLAMYEDLIREAGAVCFFTSPREAAQLVAVAQRHLEQSPIPPQNLRERIWAKLPWGKNE